MNQPRSSSCDDHLLTRYFDDDTSAEERQRVQNHLERCRRCRDHLNSLESYSQQLRNRIAAVSENVDFIALEKQVLNKALWSRHKKSGLARFMASLKYTVPAAVTAGLLVFFAYSQYWVQPVPPPSAIINSFTGSMSSVMIFETPETRQTVLWYTEEADMENDQNAV